MPDYDSRALDTRGGEGRRKQEQRIDTNSLNDAGQRVFRAAMEHANDAVTAIRRIAWNRVDCKRQSELECGCRVVLSMLICCVGLV